VGKRWTWVAWSMLALFAISVAALCVLAVATGNIHQAPTDNVALLLAFTAFMVVGALIVAHRPGNPVGWIFSAIGLLSVTGALAEEYAYYAYVTRPGALPGAIVAAWYAGWHWNLTISLTLVFTALLFPTGRLPSPRWRPLAWLAGLTTAALVLLGALQASLPEIGGRALPNPIGITGIGNPEESRVGDVLFALLIVLAVAAFASLAFRFRHARGDERQQLKWFTYAAALLPLVMLGGLLPDTLGNLFFALVIAFLPVAAGIAILRYRLYDIDRLINRTLVYGLLTTLLGGVYAGVVLVLGQVFGGVGRDPPSWVVAGATLAVAALFQPARRRIQALVDRRFNRRKYDAAETIDAFGARLRDQVDLDTLSTELLAVVDQTMQPTRVSLWLRPPLPGSRGTLPVRRGRLPGSTEHHRRPLPLGCSSVKTSPRRATRRAPVRAVGWRWRTGPGPSMRSRGRNRPAGAAARPGDKPNAGSARSPTTAPPAPAPAAAVWGGGRSWPARHRRPAPGPAAARTPTRPGSGQGPPAPRTPRRGRLPPGRG
jgi:hypothetical protein